MKIQTDANFYTKDDNINYQRSSALKSLESCNWLYYCSYVLNLPQSTNDGALKGNVCHTFFECLINPRHKKIHSKILKEKTVTAHNGAERFIKKLIKRFNLPPTQEIFDSINKMIVVGLSNDFYSKGAKIVGKEYRFKIKNENPKYAIYGTMDKIVIKGKYLIIEDYKSSKKKYEGEEITANVQALMYSLAAKKLWPDLIPKVRFIFLQYPDNPFIEIEYKDYVLEGFEEYLAAIQKKIDNFSFEDAKDGFAADKKRGENTFSGSLLCGYSKFPGHANKEGKPYWHCPYKFPYDYYTLIKDGNVIKSALNINDLKNTEGMEVKKIRYQGCPRWQQPIDDFAPKVQEVKKTNVFDDF